MMTREVRCPRREWIWAIGLSTKFYMDKHPGFYYYVFKKDNTLLMKWGTKHMTDPNCCRVAKVICAGLRMDLPQLYVPGVEEAMQEHSLSLVAAYLHVNSFY